MVVDDRSDIMHLLCAILGRKYDTVGFTDSREALHYYRLYASRIDLVVTDLEMPGVDGVSLAKEVREHSGRVLLITGYTRDDIPPGYPVLQKPFRFDTFLDAVAAQLSA